jgi:hypothetical protein
MREKLLGNRAQKALIYGGAIITGTAYGALIGNIIIWSRK